MRSKARAVIHGEIAELNLGLMCTIGPRVLSAMLDEFQMRHPMISLVLHDVTPSSISDLLLSGALDGAICSRRTARHAKLRYVSLYEESMVVAFPDGHAFAELDVVSLEEISGQRYVDRLHCEFRHELID